VGKLDQSTQPNNAVIMTYLHLLKILLLLPYAGSCNAQPRSATQENVKEAIARCLQFFQSHKDEVTPDAYLVYQFLEDRYTIPAISSRSEFMDSLLQDSVAYATYRPFLSVLFPMDFDPQLLSIEKGSNPIMIAGLWYDKLPERDRLNALIRSMDWDDGYMITHALLARAVARQQFNAPPEDELDGILLQCALDLIEAKRPTWGDLEIEALAFVQFAAPQFESPLTYLEEIAALQNEDGSWSNQGDTRGIGDHHTTVLALWALLHHAPAEYPNNGRPFVLR
jgi:hypothetical protein